MAIEITGRHMDVSETMKTYAENKALELNKEFSRIENIHVIMDVQKFRHLAEVLVQGAHLRVEAQETSEAMYTSLDAAFEKVERQIRRVREKVQHAHRARPTLPEVEKEIQADLDNLEDTE